MPPPFRTLRWTRRAPPHGSRTARGCTLPTRHRVACWCSTSGLPPSRTEGQVLMRTARIVIMTALGVALLVAAGCATSAATKHPAAQAIQRLLELREDDVRDAAAYADYFEESALATAVAEG